MNEVVKFPINTPVEVTLQDEAGKRVEGRYGEQVMYSLLDNRVMYVPPYVEQRFKELAIGAGEPLLLCKVKDSNRNRTEWSVKRAPQQLQMLANERGQRSVRAPAIGGARSRHHRRLPHLIGTAHIVQQVSPTPCPPCLAARVAPQADSARSGDQE